MLTPPQRKRESRPVLKAILFTDIVGSTRYFAEHGDKAGLRLLEVHNSALFPLIEQANGRVIKTIGDSIMAVFAQPVDALRSAFALQGCLEVVRESLSEQDQIHIRVGVHYGLVLEKDEDVFGDTVNLAERVKSSADADQVYVSRVLRDLVRNDPRFSFASVGMRSLKGAAEEIELFQLTNAPPLATRSAVARWLRRSVRGVRRHPVVLAASIAIATILIAGGIYLRVRPATTIASVAVLPFENRSQDADSDYMSDGLTESLINSLARLPNLKVLPRSVAFRYKGKGADPQKVGAELGVNVVLSGRIVQRGNSLMISVELDDIRDNKELWGEQYNRKPAELLAVQNEIAAEISQLLRPKLTGEERQKLARGSTQNPEAYQLYLKGRYYTSKFTQEGMDKGLQYFNQAIATDPNYALPYAGLAQYYIVAVDWFMSPHDSMPKAREAAEKALAIDDALADAHQSRGEVAHFYEWDWTRAEMELKRAIELNSNDSSPHESYSWLLLDTGRPDEAIAEGKRAVQIDPVSSETNAYLGIDYLYARRYGEAIDQLRKTIELDRNYWYAHNLLGRTYEASGKLPEAIAEFQRAVELEGGVAENWCNLGHAYALAGKRVEAEKIIARLQELPAHTYVPPYNMATIYAGLGEKDQAFAWLDRAYQERSDNLVLFIKVDPQIDNLRSDPRFANLLGRIRL